MKSGLKFSKCILVLLCALGLWTAAPNAAAQSAASATADKPATAMVRPAQVQVVNRELPNGLKLVMVEDHRTPDHRLANVVPRRLEGRAAGTHRLCAFVRALDVQGLGARRRRKSICASSRPWAASTTPDTREDVTVFFETFPSNYLARVLWLEADRMGGLNVSQENFDFRAGSGEGRTPAARRQ